MASFHLLLVDLFEAESSCMETKSRSSHISGSDKNLMDSWQYCDTIRPSVDGLCRDGPSEISRDPRTKRLQTQPKRLGWL